MLLTNQHKLNFVSSSSFHKLNPRRRKSFKTLKLVAAMDTVFKVTIKPGKFQGFGTILLAEDSKDGLGLEQYYRIDSFDTDNNEVAQFTTVYLRNLQNLGFCTQLANYRFFIFMNNETRVLVEGCCVNLSTLEDLFETLDGGFSYCLTKEGKHILKELLLAYSYLEKHGILFSRGEDPTNVLFLKGDQNHIYPRIINFYDDGFNEGNNNYKKLRVLLKTLLGEDRNGDTALKSFLSSTTTDYHCAVNHPALWREDSPYFFALEACTYTKKKPEAVRSLFNQDVQWKKSLTKDLQDYYKVVVQKRVQQQNQNQGDQKKNITGDYNNGEGGQLLFKRDTFVHYEQNKGAAKSKSNVEIEKWFNESLPDFNTKLYTNMKRYGFQFVEKPRRFQ